MGSYSIACMQTFSLVFTDPRFCKFSISWRFTLLQDVYVLRVVESRLVYHWCVFSPARRSRFLPSRWVLKITLCNLPVINGLTDITLAVHFPSRAKKSTCILHIVHVHKYTWVLMVCRKKNGNGLFLTHGARARAEWNTHTTHNGAHFPLSLSFHRHKTCSSEGSQSRGHTLEHSKPYPSWWREARDVSTNPAWPRPLSQVRPIRRSTLARSIRRGTSSTWGTRWEGVSSTFTLSLYPQREGRCGGSWVCNRQHDISDQISTPAANRFRPCRHPRASRRRCCCHHSLPNSKTRTTVNITRRGVPCRLRGRRRWHASVPLSLASPLSGCVCAALADRYLCWLSPRRDACWTIHVDKC